MRFFGLLLFFWCIVSSGDALAEAPLEQALERKDYGLALQLAREEAEKGDPDAQYVLGSMLADGQHVTKDIETAVLWLDKSGRQGNTDALGMLAMMHYTGTAPEARLCKAWKYATIAEQLGNSDAMMFAARILIDITDEEVALGEEAIRRWRQSAEFPPPMSEN